MKAEFFGVVMSACFVLPGSLCAEMGDVTGGGSRAGSQLAMVAPHVPLAGEVSSASLAGVNVVSKALSGRGATGFHAEGERVGGASPSAVVTLADGDDGTVLWAGILLVLALVARRVS